MPETLAHARPLLQAFESGGVPCRGQWVELPHGRWDWVHLLLEPVAGAETVWLRYDDAADPEFLSPGKGSTARIPVTRRSTLLALGLPERPDLRVTGLTLVGPPDLPGTATLVDLVPLVNNRGVASAPGAGIAGFNIWDNSFPADELPPPGGVCEVGGVPFQFPLAGPADNVRCRGQVVPLPEGCRPSWLYVLGASERRTEDLLQLSYATGETHPQWLRMSDFWPDTPSRFADRLAFRCRRMLYPRHVQPDMAPAIWQQRVPVTVPGTVVAVTLPDNPAMHVFAVTAVAEDEPTEGDATDAR